MLVSQNILQHQQEKSFQSYLGRLWNMVTFFHRKKAFPRSFGKIGVKNCQSMNIQLQVTHTIHILYTYYTHTQNTFDIFGIIWIYFDIFRSPPQTSTASRSNCPGVEAPGCWDPAAPIARNVHHSKRIQGIPRSRIIITTWWF